MVCIEYGSSIVFNFLHVENAMSPMDSKRFPWMVTRFKLEQRKKAEEPMERIVSGIVMVRMSFLFCIAPCCMLVPSNMGSRLCFLRLLC